MSTIGQLTDTPWDDRFKALEFERDILSEQVKLFEEMFERAASERDALKKELEVYRDSATMIKNLQTEVDRLKKERRDYEDGMWVAQNDRDCWRTLAIKGLEIVSGYLGPNFDMYKDGKHPLYVMGANEFVKECKSTLNVQKEPK